MKADNEVEWGKERVAWEVEWGKERVAWEVEWGKFQYKRHAPPMLPFLRVNSHTRGNIGSVMCSRADLEKADNEVETCHVQCRPRSKDVRDAAHPFVSAAVGQDKPHPQHQHYVPDGE